VGKTRLSLEIAERAQERFPDGVTFVPLADISDPAHIVSKIAQVLDVREGGSQPLLETLIGYLQDKRQLLVLDNFEQLATGAPVVGELLTACPGLSVLVSSRVLLQLRGEYEVAVPPLDTPGERLLELEQLGRNPAVRLFVERARAASAAFALGPANASAVAEICRKLDGLPLAIELAAARIRLLTPQAMLGRLDNRLGLLTGGARDLPLRQQTLRGSIELSHGLLAPEDQRLFARLAVFVGGFTLESADAVCGGDVLDGIATLVNNSLLRTEAALDGQPRFRMLETIREYALERLADLGEQADLQRAHAGYFFGKIANEMGGKLFSPEALPWLNWLESEHANIGVALGWGLANSAEPAPAIIGLLSWYWYRRGYLSEGRAWTERALASPLTAGWTPGRVFALHANALLATWQGDLHAALSSGESCVEVAREIGQPQLISRSVLALGVVRLNMGDYAGARPLVQEALNLFQAARSIFFTTSSLVHLGNLELGLGNAAAARAYLDRAYAGSRDYGERWSNAFVLNNLGEVARVQGDYDAAKRYYEESEALLRAMGDQDDLARLIHNLGYVAKHDGDLDAAKARFRESLDLFRLLANRRGIAECLMAFAGVAIREGRAIVAARLFGAADKMLTESGSSWWPADGPEVDRIEVEIRAELDERDFDLETERGRRMTLEEALAMVS
jgi:non-specific serine/threonine protein kinase